MKQQQLENSPLISIASWVVPVFILLAGFVLAVALESAGFIPGIL